jgi:hypothetical protein
MPGWNITEVVHEQPSQHSESLPIDQEMDSPDDDSNSNLEIDS